MPIHSTLSKWKSLPIWLGPLGVAIIVVGVAADPDINSVSCQRQANGETLISKTAAAGEYWKFESSKDLTTWDAIYTGQSTGTISYLDTGAPYQGRRFYRAAAVAGTNVVTGDQVQTNDGVVTIKPIYHASFYLHWARPSGNVIIYGDPSSQGAPAGRFTGVPKADLVLLTHAHSDHLSNSTLDGIRNGTTTRIIASQATQTAMGTTTLGTTLKSMTTIFKTGQTVAANNSPALSVLGITVEGVPAYNSYHTKGDCNAYILTIGGKRFFISGDTGTSAEMNVMANIDVAFLCINQPFTMTVPDAATTTRTFRPKVVYPYHLKNSDSSFSNVDLFKTTVGADFGIEVRNRSWY